MDAQINFHNPFTQGIYSVQDSTNPLVSLKDPI